MKTRPGCLRGGRLLYHVVVFHTIQGPRDRNPPALGAVIADGLIRDDPRLTVGGL